MLNSNAPHFIYWLNACKKEKKTTKLNEIKQYTTWQTYTRAFCSQFTHSSFTVFYLHNSHVCAGEMNWKRNENERKTEKLSFHSTIMIENNCILFTLFVHLSKSRRYTLFARFPKDLYWLFVFFFSFFPQFMCARINGRLISKWRESAWDVFNKQRKICVLVTHVRQVSVYARACCMDIAADTKTTSRTFRTESI